MKCKLLIALILLSFSGYSQKDITIGKTHSIHSNILDEDRVLEIYLPRDYQKSDKIYPVIYLLDSFYNFSHAVGTVEYLYLNRLIPQMIIVGVRNTRRSRDLSPESHGLAQNDKMRLPFRGGADNFLDFMEKELMPYVKQNYRAAPYEVIVGHSLGGLFNTYAFFKNPELFDAYLTISPSLWYPNNLITKDFEEVFKNPSDLNATFYLSLANENKGTMRGDVLKLSGKFHNYINAHEDADLRFKYEPMPEESHGSVGLPSIFNGLRFIFEPVKYEIPETAQEIIVAGGPDKVRQQVLDYYKELSEKYGFEMDIQPALIDLGYNLLGTSKFKKDALEVFRMNVKKHPESFDAYSALGVAYEEIGELEKAKLNYEKALELVKQTEDPEWTFYEAELMAVKNKIESRVGSN